MKLNDDGFKKIASLYTEMDGKRLKSEIEIAAKAIPQHAQIDVSVKKRIRKDKHHQYYRWGGSLVACLAILLLASPLLKINKSEQHQMELISAPSEESLRPMINLSMNHLPERFQVAQVAQDQAETIYYLKDNQHDDVLLVARYAEELPDSRGLKQVVIGNKKAQGISQQSYHVLRFYQDGILYTLSCRYEFGTLTELSKSF